MRYKDIGERFMRYASVITQSEEGAETTPSTPEQRDLARLLYDELREMGASEVYYDEERCYVYATVPASDPAGKAPVIGLMAHMDTTAAVRQKKVTPRRIEQYDGGDILLNETLGIVLSPQEYPSLKKHIGSTLVVTDGTSVLGGDDKAGVAAIMEVFAALLADPSLPHGTVRLCFTPDEEVGNGTLCLDLKHFDCDYAYTVDGEDLGELSYETFNAASGEVTIHGVSCHPGSALGIMKNALLIAMEFAALLPPLDIPARTSGHEGFFHLGAMEGNVDQAVMQYIIRDHDRSRFEERKSLFQKAAREINRRYGAGTVEIEVKDSYYNMQEKIEPHRHLVDYAVEVMEEMGIRPILAPIRGGTDGSRLSYMGIPCPNLGTGSYNIHGRYEYVSVTEMEENVSLLLKLLAKYAE